MVDLPPVEKEATRRPASAETGLVPPVGSLRRTRRRARRPSPHVIDDRYDKEGELVDNGDELKGNSVMVD